MKQNKNKIARIAVRLTFFNETDRTRNAGIPWEMFNLVKFCGLMPSKDDGTYCDWNWDGSVFVSFDTKRNETAEGFASKLFLLAESLVCQLEDRDDPSRQAVSVRVRIGEQRSRTLFVADAKTGVDFLPRK